MLAILASLLFVAVKIVPLYFTNYQLQDSMQTEARFAVANRKSEQDVRDDITKKMQELGVAAKPEDLKVSFQDLGTGMSGVVTISLDYSVPVDLLVYQFDLPFHARGDNKTI